MEEKTHNYNNYYNYHYGGQSDVRVALYSLLLPSDFLTPPIDVLVVMHLSMLSARVGRAGRPRGI